MTAFLQDDSGMGVRMAVQEEVVTINLLMGNDMGTGYTRIISSGHANVKVYLATLASQRG